MKCYVETEREKRRFILHYDVIKGRMILHLASKEDYSVPYTETNKEKIDKRMKKQVKCAFKKIDAFNGMDSDEKTWWNEDLILWHSIMLVCFIFSPLKWTNLPKILYYLVKGIFILVSSCGLIGNVAVLLKQKSIYNDINKNGKFISKEEEINDALQKDKNILLGTSKEVQKQVSEDNNTMSLNTMHIMKYKELLKIIENVKRYRDLDFEFLESIQPNEEKNGTGVQFIKTERKPK